MPLYPAPFHNVELLAVAAFPVVLDEIVLFKVITGAVAVPVTRIFELPEVTLDNPGCIFNAPVP